MRNGVLIAGSEKDENAKADHTLQRQAPEWGDECRVKLHVFHFIFLNGSRLEIKFGLAGGTYQSAATQQILNDVILPRRVLDLVAAFFGC